MSSFFNRLPFLESSQYNRRRFWGPQKPIHHNNKPSNIRLLRWLGCSPSKSDETVQRLLAQRFEHLNIQVFTWTCTAYPHSLRYLDPRPPVIFSRGQLPHLDRPCVGVVGARKPTAMGLKLAFSLGQQLVRAGLTVVSGMAAGIDAEALRGALVQKPFSPAVAVLGTAITRCYPSRHYALFSHLNTHGLVLSEYPPWFQTLPHHFVARNSIIAALSDGLILVEAGRQSGTFHTVEAALNLGKPIFVMDLPAPGNQKLIQEGAQPIRCLEDAFPTLFQGLGGQKPLERSSLAP